jgi:DNA-binding transcriptional MerR regulator
MTRPDYPLVRVRRYELDGFARRAGVHPDLVRRFVSLGLLDADRDPAGRLWFGPAQLATVARIHRLHAELSLNYAAIGLVLDLLDEIDALHTQARLARR